jgi:hypothetical protein
MSHPSKPGLTIFEINAKVIKILFYISILLDKDQFRNAHLKTHRNILFILLENLSHSISERK